MYALGVLPSGRKPLPPGAIQAAFLFYSTFYSPSPEYFAACGEDEWQGEPFRSLGVGGLASEEFHSRYPAACHGEVHFFIVFYYLLAHSCECANKRK